MLSIFLVKLVEEIHSTDRLLIYSTLSPRTMQYGENKLEFLEMVQKGKLC